MNIALILSGGIGSRMGTEIPKQYIEVGGKPVIAYCVEQLINHDMIDRVQIVASPEWQERIKEWLEKPEFDRKFMGFSLPGENRQMSVLHGLEDIRAKVGSEAVVLIHDAARPCLPSELVTECLNALGNHDGVLPVLPMKDTMYFSDDGDKISGLLERSKIFAGQAPEVFRLDSYYKANKKLMPKKILEINGSTEPAVMAGLDIVMIPGRESNFKITTEEDLKRFHRMVLEE